MTLWLALIGCSAVRAGSCKHLHPSLGSPWDSLLAYQSCARSMPPDLTTAAGALRIHDGRWVNYLIRLSRTGLGRNCDIEDSVKVKLAAKLWLNRDAGIHASEAPAATPEKAAPCSLVRVSLLSVQIRQSVSHVVVLLT